MKRNATWGLLGVLAVAATLSVSLEPRGNRREEAEMAGRQVRANRAQSNTSATTACDGIAQVLQLFLEVKSVPRPASCGPGGSSKQGDAGNGADSVNQQSLDLKFVIVTFPDPVHTHLALFFDRLAEAIQEAAQDEGYSYENSWLPWEGTDSSYSRLADNDIASIVKNCARTNREFLFSATLLCRVQLTNRMPPRSRSYRTILRSRLPQPQNPTMA